MTLQKARQKVASKQFDKITKSGDTSILKTNAVCNFSVGSFYIRNYIDDNNHIVKTERYIVRKEFALVTDDNGKEYELNTLEPFDITKYADLVETK